MTYIFETTIYQNMKTDQLQFCGIVAWNVSVVIAYMCPYKTTVGLLNRIKKQPQQGTIRHDTIYVNCAYYLAETTKIYKMSNLWINKKFALSSIGVLIQCNCE